MAMMTNTNKAMIAVNRGAIVIAPFALGIGLVVYVPEVRTASGWAMRMLDVLVDLLGPVVR